MKPTKSDELHQIVQRLQRAGAFPHQTGRFEVIETHISFILLTGEYAYKLKKPVDLGFLDFSSAEKREHFCQEEVRLNRRLAPEFYLAVVAITEGDRGPEIEGEGRTLWHAVQMRQFGRDSELDVLVPRGAIERAHIDGLAIDIARFHQNCACSAPESPFGTPRVIGSHILGCFDISEPCVRGERRKKRFATIQDRVAESLQRNSPVFVERKLDGFVREGHGDLHLRNMFLLKDRVVPFDCLEFNDELRWIDVISDIAFLTMDLDYHGHHELATAFLSGYLEQTGDYDGLALLRLYQVYRAMVRAKVACVREMQEKDAGQSTEAEDREVNRHLDLAHSYLRKPRPRLLITCGLAGSGKTTLAAQILGPLGAVRIRSDVERKRLAGTGLNEERGHSGIDTGLYAPEMTARTYRRLLDLADSILADGWSVIVDAAFLRRAERDDFLDLARRRAVPFAIVCCRASLPVLEERVQRRERSGHDASDATAEVLRHQVEFAELPGAEEMEWLIEIDTGGDVDPELIAGKVRAV